MGYIVKNAKGQTMDYRPTKGQAETLADELGTATGSIYTVEEV